MSLKYAIRYNSFSKTHCKSHLENNIHIHMYPRLNNTKLYGKGQGQKECKSAVTHAAKQWLVTVLSEATSSKTLDPQSSDQYLDKLAKVLAKWEQFWGSWGPLIVPDSQAPTALKHLSSPGS